MTPEQQARQQIDAQLVACGWAIQDYAQYNPAAAHGIALREVPLKSGQCDYLLLVDRKPVGVIEAKKEGTLLSGVAEQTAHYAVTRKRRWERLDEDLTYAAQELDRSVVVPSQIRTVLQAFKDALFTELFPGRTLIPKTLIFCKDDSHAEDVVHLVREVFGKGNDFAKKITYKTYNPETKRYEKSETLIQEFRTSPQLRIAVTVDMIATGTDIKPLE